MATIFHFVEEQVVLDTENLWKNILYGGVSKYEKVFCVFNLEFLNSIFL